MQNLRVRERAARRGLRFIAKLAAYEPVADYLGSGALWFCRSLVLSGSAALRADAHHLARALFEAWRRQQGELGDDADAGAIAEHVRAYGAAEAMGFHDWRTKTRIRRMARAFSATDFLGFDPRREPPPLNLPDVCSCGASSSRERRRCEVVACGRPLTWMNRHRAWCLALTSAYCGERYGVMLGARYRDVLKWLPTLRPYPTRGRLLAPAFADISYAVTHVVYTLNDYGRYTLSHVWLPWEYEFLRNGLDRAIGVGDPDIIGEYLDTLRTFSTVGDSDPQVRRGFDYLLSTQNSDGSWGEWDWDTLYTGFHATWAAVDGLREFRRDGHGIAFPEMLPRLMKWAAEY
jgi:hypothetical protein